MIENHGKRGREDERRMQKIEVASNHGKKGTYR